MKQRTTTAQRPAFTIVELLVAMALIIFIMYILAEAFAAGTSAFRNLKSIGDMNERLRSANTTLRRFLTADHFEGRKRLSDVDFWKTGQIQNGQPPSGPPTFGPPAFGPPQEGFFRIVQSNPSNSEGSDLDSLFSFRSHSQALHFTVKLRGNNRADFFRASVPNFPPANVSPLLSLPFADSRFQDAIIPNGPGLISSSAAEVAIFLRDTGTFTDDVDFATSSPQKLYTMHFRQRLLMPDNDIVSTITGGPVPVPVPYNMAPNFIDNWRNYLEVSTTRDPDPANSANLYFNNLQDVTMPGRRWGLFAIDTTTGLINASNLPETGISPANLVGGEGNFQVSSFPTGNPPAVRNSVYPRLGDEDPTNLLNLAGNDVLLTDVLSWHTSVLLDNNAYALFTDTQNPLPNPYKPGMTPRPVDFVELSDDMFVPYINNGFVPYNGVGLPIFPRLFDTWSSRKDNVYDYSNWPTSIPMCQYAHPKIPNHPLNGTKVRILAIKITLRIWDSKTKQTRQSSIVVDM